MLAVMFVRSSDHAAPMTFSTWDLEDSAYRASILRFVHSLTRASCFWPSAFLWPLTRQLRGYKCGSLGQNFQQGYWWEELLPFLVPILPSFCSRLHVCFDSSGGHTSTEHQYSLAKAPQTLAAESTCVVTNTNVSLIHSWITSSIWADDSRSVPSVVSVPFSSLSPSWLKPCKMRTWMAGFYLRERDQCLRFPLLIAPLVLLSPSTKGSSALLEWVS